MKWRILPPLMKKKTTKKLLSRVNDLILKKNIVDETFSPKNISSSSAQINQNSLFVAVKGEKHDGHNFIPEAIQKGAKIVIYENKDYEEFLKNKSVSGIMVSNSRLAHSLLLEEFYDNPASKLKLIAVTGTNGKTTTTYILKNLLSTQHICGMISTVEYSAPGFTKIASRTTPLPEDFQSLLNKMVKKNCKFVVMELSSHGLEQKRTGSAKFAGAIFTNLSGDHLDYHKNMENYYNAKKILFEKLLQDDAFAVINIDNIYGKKLFDELKNPFMISCSFKSKANFKILNLKNSFNGLEFTLEGEGKSHKIRSNLCGKYNAMNIAQAFILANKLGINSDIIISSLEKGINVPGRLEKFILKNQAVAFVDYAHSDDALENVLRTLSEFKNKRLILVFGCGGNRDKTKRPRMGAIAEKLSDIAIITNDNPRFEKPETIINDILSGFEKPEKAIIIKNRKNAIQYAVQISEKNDIILVAGKGHEIGQEIEGEIIPYNDRDQLQKYT